MSFAEWRALEGMATVCGKGEDREGLINAADAEIAHGGEREEEGMNGVCMTAPERARHPGDSRKGRCHKGQRDRFENDSAD